jgi:hypothetical protein
MSPTFVAALMFIAIAPSLLGSHTHDSIRNMVMLVLLLMSLTRPPRGGSKFPSHADRGHRRLSGAVLCVALLLFLRIVPVHAQEAVEGELVEALFGNAEAETGLGRNLSPTERDYVYPSKCRDTHGIFLDYCLERFFEASGAKSDVLARLREVERSRLKEKDVMDKLEERIQLLENSVKKTRPKSFFKAVRAGTAPASDDNKSDPERYEIYRSGYPLDAMTKARSGNAWRGSLSDTELGAIVVRFCEGDKESLAVMRVLMERLAARQRGPLSFRGTATSETFQSGVWMTACDENTIDLRGAFRWLTSTPTGKVGDRLRSAAYTGNDLKAPSSKAFTPSEEDDFDIFENLPGKEVSPEDTATGKDLVRQMLVDFGWESNGWQKWQMVVLLANGFTARDGSEVLGITENAWYQRVGRLRADFKEKAPRLGLAIRFRQKGSGAQD